MKTKLMLTALILLLINLAMRSPDFMPWYMVAAMAVFGIAVFEPIKGNYLNEGRG